jgi:acetate---CoA ligase (ADP-forming)
MGYPVVLKNGDEGALHKTDTGGVHLNLATDQSVGVAANRLREGGAKTILVQSHVRGGVEMIVGLQTDPALGAFVLVGLGGVLTEIVNDASMRPAGLLEGEGGEMLNELRMVQVLRGARGAQPADLDAIIDVISRIDAISRALGPRIQSIDINPLIALPNGALAVDALIVPSSEV